MTLPPGDALEDVVAPLAPLGGLDRLAVEDGGAGALLPPDLVTHLGPQPVIEPLPDVVVAPRTVGVVAGAPGGRSLGIIRRAHSPTRDGEDALEDLTELDGTGVAYVPALTSSAAG